MGGRRALHFVFKVGDRAQTARFYRELLGMRDMSVAALRDQAQGGPSSPAPSGPPGCLGGAHRQER